MYQTSSLNVYGRSSAEEAAAAAALTHEIGENILSEEGAKSDIKENLHPKSNTSKLSATSSTSIGIRNGDDDDNGLSVFDDDDDTSIDIEGRKSETSHANQSIDLSLSASNYSFSAAVAPISLDNQSTKRVNTSNSQQDFTKLQSRYAVKYIYSNFLPFNFERIRIL